MFPEIACDDVFRLETRRLWLRWPRQSDAPALAALAGDWDVARMTATIPHPYGLDDSECYIAEARAANARGAALRFVLTLKTFPRKIVGMIAIENRGGEPELAFWLGRLFWGRGLMSEATAALSDAFFRLTEGQMLNALVLADNAASRVVLEKTGFSQVERLESGPGRHADSPVERLLLRRRDWQAIAGSRLQPAFASGTALA